ncbi:MAG TPA: type II secretion system F family protein, partial [Actinomycetota bacterium]|nr:type II secretion system F family protein [Actinomycetota bacterium]
SMSEIWLILSVLSLALSIILVGVYIDQTRAEKQRAVRLLETQVVGPSGVAAPSTNLREESMKESFGNRVVIPIVGRAGQLARRVTPLDARDRIDKKLLLAGSPAGWDAERVLAFKIIGAVGGFVLSIVLIQFVNLSPFLQIIVTALLTFVGFVAPDSVLNGQVENRKKEILKTLSDTLDLLTISVEAGLSLNAAIAMVVRNVPGVLSSEFARMLQEIQLGVPRSDAFRHLSERTDVEELNAFALAMVQADVFGVSIASVLRTQAAQLRIKRRQAIEAKAAQTPVKIVFPLIICVLPSLFVVIIGPGAIQIFQSFTAL